MTRLEIGAKLSQIIQEQLGNPADRFRRLRETQGMVIEHGIAPKNLQDALGCTSLEIVSVQMAVEEAFGLKFATGSVDRARIDEEWDQLWSMAGLTDFVVKWTEGK